MSSFFKPLDTVNSVDAICGCTDLMWHLLQTIQCTNVIQCVNGWRETTVQAEDLTQRERELCKIFTAISRCQRILRQRSYFGSVIILVYFLEEEGFSPAHPPGLWGVGSQRGLWNTSRRLRCRISSSTRHRNRTPVWSVCSRGFLAISWCVRDSEPTNEDDKWSVKKFGVFARPS